MEEYSPLASCYILIPSFTHNRSILGTLVTAVYYQHVQRYAAH